ncbi:MAG: multicopper oxidase domain-containing protein, partial [Planctomycetaceae bacterium]|nr:multicopper oxidase domain-containing protein [Planctomycetaceae bacterium]
MQPLATQQKRNCSCGVLPGVFLVLGFLVGTSEARVIETDLFIQEGIVEIAGRSTQALTINGQIPAPTLRWREGDSVTLRVTNLLQETSSIHWHGIILPSAMDGVQVSLQVSKASDP